MRRSLLGLATVALGVILIDRWTKRWAAATLPFNQPVPVLGDVLRLTYTRNSGVAFGLGQGTGFPYWLFSLAAIAAIAVLFLRHPRMGALRLLALSLILGGAIGNLIDRVARGEVTDFIEIGVRGWHWPVFNVADTAVTVGVVLFALAFGRRAEPAPAAAATGGAPGDERSAHDHGAAGAGRGAAGPLPGGRPDGPLA